MRTVEVHLPAGSDDRSYPVVVGEGVLGEVDRVVSALGVSRVAVVSQAGIGVDVALSVPSERIEIGVGEDFKTLATVEHLCRLFAASGLTRRDAVVAVGGGMVTDVAGFAAASYHRGIAVVHVPTTLLGMIDAAIGGKTGVNLPEGKNLVGAFWQPSGVICDLLTLATLPERELRCGNGEMAKYHFLTGDDLASMDLADRVARCVEIKAEVVASDERESGRRAILNYGHTLAHALEIASSHKIAHGEAVAIGLVFAARLAERLGRIDANRVQHHLDVVAGLYGLETEVPAVGTVDELLALMARDKKALDGLTFVLDGPNGVEPVVGVDPEVVRSLLLELV
ncbi:MAG: 3-dehydroquinate synthase [Actinomycetota bacterium]|jgi:5-deoxy-5-amino-3-dehydroquinate synthase|nr:3-dehydroquinate synthase [Actinomycetota bacterium]MDA3029209.1 3-dehydroquinate synthase [Actinomycetota bacterium]